MISLVLPEKEARDWENWINSAYQKYKSSNWKWVVRIIVGALIGWLMGELIIAAVGDSEFVAGLVATYKWIKPVIFNGGQKYFLD